MKKSRKFLNLLNTTDHQVTWKKVVYIFKAISSAWHWYFFFPFQRIFQFHPEFQDDSAFLNLPIVCEFTIPSKPNKENPPQLLER